MQESQGIYKDFNPTTTICSSDPEQQGIPRIEGGWTVKSAGGYPFTRQLSVGRDARGTL
jgi:hypothetical protein